MNWADFVGSKEIFIENAETTVWFPAGTKRTVKK